MTFLDTEPALLVSLPRNDRELAKAAVAAGADGIKTHVNVNHRASGTAFGSVAEERAELEQILELGVPTGLVVGGENQIDRDEIETAGAMGFAFFDAYLGHAPSWYTAACGTVPAVVAVSGSDPVDRVRVLERLGYAAVEASLAAPDEYGTPLRADRLADYAALARLTRLPLIVPSQHALTPDDVPALVAAGAGALLIGAVVTGTDPDRIDAATAAFREAIDSVRPLRLSAPLDEADEALKEE